MAQRRSKEEIELLKAVIGHLKKLRFRDVIHISGLLGPIEEDETDQRELTDNEIPKEFWIQMLERKTVKMRPLSQKHIPEPRKLKSFVMPVACFTCLRKVTKLLIKSFATSSLIFATI